MCFLLSFRCMLSLARVLAKSRLRQSAGEGPEASHPPRRRGEYS